MSLNSVAETSHAFGNGTTATIPMIAAMTSPNRTIAVYMLILTANGATTVTLQDTTGAALSQVFPLAGNKALILDILDDMDPWFVTAAGLGVQLAQTGSANIGFDIYYQGGPFYTTPPGTHIPVFVPATWNTSDVLFMTLSNGNLTATATTGSTPGVRASAGLSTGKYYFEATMTTWAQFQTSVGVCLASVPLANLSTDPVGTCFVSKSGQIWPNGGSFGTSLGTRANGDIIGVAADLGAQLIWFRVAPAGNWNGSATANPVTGAGGAPLSGLSGPLFPGYGAPVSGEVCTANFGASAFSGAVPSGFTTGWGIMQ